MSIGDFNLVKCFNLTFYRKSLIFFRIKVHEIFYNILQNIQCQIIIRYFKRILKYNCDLLSRHDINLHF